MGDKIKNIFKFIIDNYNYVVIVYFVFVYITSLLGFYNITNHDIFTLIFIVGTMIINEIRGVLVDMVITINNYAKEE